VRLGRSPVIFFFLRIPEGVCYGVVASLIPFLITRAGLPVTVAGSVTAIAVLPYVMAALCGPVIDLTLTLTRWYWIGLLASATGLVLVGALPFRREMLVVLTTAAFLYETGGTLISVAVGSLIAGTVSDCKKGRGRHVDSGGTPRRNSRHTRPLGAPSHPIVRLIGCSPQRGYK
jgi:MFS transporter, PAT family, beta-lactamase induction signal transducer AmpG